MATKPKPRYILQLRMGIAWCDQHQYRYADGREREAVDKAQALGRDYRVVDTWEGKVVYG